MKVKIVLASLIIAAAMLVATAARASSFVLETGDTLHLDKVRMSLLTCAPGDEIYELFGHTAIRYVNADNGTDLVFNYGMFSFNTPHFVWRFVKGETDYQLGITNFDWFWPEYHRRGSEVYEQELNLTDEQKLSLLLALVDNYAPENRIYRYNFFYDNCTTRARDKIEEAVGAVVDYGEDFKPTTFRNIVHQFANGHEWSQLGMDICIGSQADAPIDARETMFAPFYYKDFLDKAFYTGSTGARVKLAGAPRVIVTAAETAPQPWMPSPMLVFATLFALTAATCVIEWRMGRTLWGIDIILFGAAGLGGLVVAFLVLFSTHPATSPNYMLLFMHPAHLLLMPFYIYKEVKRRKSYYHLTNAVVIVLFFAFIFVIPQEFNGAILFLALSLLLRSVCYTLRTNCKKPTAA